MSFYKLNSTADEDMVNLLMQVGDPAKEVAMAAAVQFAEALQTPLRSAVLDGSVTGGIYETVPLRGNATPEFPLDIVTPGVEEEHCAYTIPSHGRMPQKLVEAGYVMVSPFEVGSTITIKQKIARDARWDIMARMLQVIEAHFVKKMNKDGMHAIIAAGLDRSILVYDANASQGYFTKRLVSLLGVTMRRNGGGNSASLARKMLTHLLMSPELIEDMRNWTIDQAPDSVRASLFTASDGTLKGMFPGLTLIDLDELGVGQEYQQYYTTDLGGSLQASDVELLIGLNLGPDKSLVMPVRENVTILPDDSNIHERKIGFRGFAEYGIGVLDNRDVILGSA